MVALLPGAKVTARDRCHSAAVDRRDCFSPPGHSASPHLSKMSGVRGAPRTSSGGKPSLPIKFCVGNRWEILALLCKAMLETGIARLSCRPMRGADQPAPPPAEFLDHVLAAPLRQGPGADRRNDA